MKKLPSPAKTVRGLTLLIIIIFCVCAGYLLLRALQYKNAPTVAEIYQNGTLIMSVPLDKTKEPRCFTIEGENGAYNVIEVKDGKIGIVSASCPDRICVKQGYHGSGLLAITCLPNHLVIRIKEASDGESGLDAITY